MASATNKQKCQPGTSTLGFESSFFEGGVIPSHLLFFYKLPIFVFERTVVESAGNETRSRAVPFWMALPSQIVLYLNTVFPIAAGQIGINPQLYNAMEIPQGNSREDNKARKQIIKDFYAAWIAGHPDKRIWYNSLNGFIHVKGQSINETAGHASLSYESTLAVFQLTEVLNKATVKETWTPKYGDKNQRPYSEMRLLRWKNYRLIVGYQKSKSEWVQYYLGSEQTKK